ncbi:MAG: GNAT family N-acetyltransferase [Promethearchaeota archaeon]
MIQDLEIIEKISEGNLIFRKITEDDAEFVYKSLNEENLTSFLSLGPLNSIEQSKKLLKKYLKYWDKLIQFNYIIELNLTKKAKIGSISLWNVSWRHKRAQIGIWLIPSFWNKGFGERSINLIKIIGLFHLKLNRLEAYIAIENERSISLFEKCGFKKEGVLRQYLNFQEKFHDALIMGFIKNK